MKKFFFIGIVLFISVTLQAAVIEDKKGEIPVKIETRSKETLQIKHGNPESVSKDDQASSVAFREVWGYLMRGEEKVFKGDEPVTDICYFSCGVNSRGRISVNVAPPSLPDLNGRKRRVHIVISDLTNSELMHYSLNPKYGVRDFLVADIVELSKKFDGVQIDFEAVADSDAADFQEFLRLIKAGMERGKIFSIALPSRVSSTPGDAYDYGIISGIVDRAFIMAYDQHWSTSKPGPVASLSWCRDIITFAKKTIPSEKLIMGIPLYGREWKENRIKARTVRVKQYKNVYAKKSGKKKSKKKVVVKTIRIPARVEMSSKSVRSCSLPELASNSRAKKEYSVDTGLTMKINYSKSSKAILFCDDIKAIKEKFILYREFVDSVGFWRLGMQNPELWKEIKIVD